MINSSEVWFCVDQDGEKMFTGIKPVRWKELSLISKELNLWTAPGEEGEDYLVSLLPDGFIYKIFGENLTWKDEPIEYKGSDPEWKFRERYKRYENIKRGFSYSYQETDMFLKTLMTESILTPNRLLETISSYIASEIDWIKNGGMVRRDRFDSLAVSGKGYACLDNAGKLCLVIAGSEEWLTNVSWVLPKMDLGVLCEILEDINNKELEL